MMSCNKVQAPERKMIRSLVPLKLHADTIASSQDVHNQMEETARKAPVLTVVDFAGCKPIDVTPRSKKILSGFLNTMATKIALKQHGGPFTEEQAAAYTLAFADAFEETINYLPSIMNAVSLTSHTYSHSTEASQLHASILKTVFGSFGMDSDSQKKLDGALTGINSLLRSNVAVAKGGMKHTVVVYSSETDETGSYNLHLHAIYLEVDAKSWAESSKCPSKEYINFHMNFYHQDLVINSAFLETALDRLIEDAETLANAGTERLDALTHTIDLNEKEPVKSFYYNFLHCGHHGAAASS